MYLTIAELVELALHLDMVDWGGRHSVTWRWSQEGGLVPDWRDLGVMEEQDEGSIGRSWLATNIAIT